LVTTSEQRKELRVIGILQGVDKKNRGSAATGKSEGQIGRESKARSAGRVEKI